VKRLWAPWRMAWITASKAPATGCVFCSARDGRDDRASLVLHRSEHAFLILNSFPYASGHLMAVINRHTGALVEADRRELADAMGLVQRAVTALSAEYRPDGFNVGLNQGRAAGAGIDDHLHIHVVPRWNGDSNFMSVLDDTRVLPETLDRTWERVRGRLGG
jgi:ATP adenylyltransferase